MKTISLSLPEDLLEKSRRYAATMRVSRAEYIRLAVQQLNREIAARTHAKRLMEVSRRVRKESMRVNAEFAAIEKDPDAQAR